MGFGFAASGTTTLGFTASVAVSSGFAASDDLVSPAAVLSDFATSDDLVPSVAVPSDFTASDEDLGTAGSGILGTASASFPVSEATGGLESFSNSPVGEGEVGLEPSFDFSVEGDFGGLPPFPELGVVGGSGALWVGVSGRGSGASPVGFACTSGLSGSVPASVSDAVFCCVSSGFGPGAVSGTCLTSSSVAGGALSLVFFGCLFQLRMGFHFSEVENHGRVGWKGSDLTDIPTSGVSTAVESSDTGVDAAGVECASNEGCTAVTGCGFDNSGWIRGIP